MKKLISALLVLTTVLLCFAGCDPSTGSTPPATTAPTTSATVNVSSISLSKTDLTMTVDEKIPITATVSPLSATNKNISWSSTNPAVADYVNGNIVALGKGSCSITATSHNGIVASCSVHVSSKGTIRFDSDSYTVFEGNSKDLYLIFSSDLEDFSGSVTSSDNSVVKATYDYSYKPQTNTHNIKVKVEGKSAGTATITVTTKGGATCSAKIIVKKSQCDKVTVNLSQSLPCSVSYLHRRSQTIYSKASITNVEIEKKQYAEDDTFVYVTVHITGTCTYTLDDSAYCNFMVYLYKENDVICDSKLIRTDRLVAGVQFTESFVFFKADISSGNNREFTIKFGDYRI